MSPHHHRRHPHGMHGPLNLPDITIDADTPLPYRVYHQLRKVNRGQKHLLFRSMSEKDTHPGQAIMLWMLSEHEGVSQSELADTLNVARPTVSIMLHKLEKAGLIERRKDETDRRYLRIYLTDAGRALHADLQTVHAGIVEAMVGSMNEADQRELERLLGIVEENLAAAQRPDAPPPERQDT